jgi:hypothetical protein
LVFFSIESDNLEFFRVFSFFFFRLNSFWALLRAIDLSIELVLCFVVKKKCTKYKFTFFVQAIKSSAILLLFSNPAMISSSLALIWEKRRLGVIVRIGWIKVCFWRSNLDAHFFIWDKKDVVYTFRIGLVQN